MKGETSGISVGGGVQKWEETERILLDCRCMSIEVCCKFVGVIGWPKKESF